METGIRWTFSIKKIISDLCSFIIASEIHHESSVLQPGFPQAGFGHNPNLYFPAQVPNQQNNQFAWAQYQQMLAAQSRLYHSQDSPSEGSVESRRRATSGPQRPQQMNHNENMQHYPGAHAGFTPARSNSAQSSSLPPGAMAPPSSHSAVGSNSSSQGFHPYRRGPSRTSEGGSGGGSTTSAAAAAAAAAAAHLPPPSRPRARTASTNSSGSERSDRARSQQPNGSYSSATSGSLRGVTAVGAGAIHSGSSSPSRGGPPIPSKSSSRPDGPIRSESASTATSAHTAGTSRPYHSRAESFSSASSQQSADRTFQPPAPTNGSSSAQGSGRSTPTPGSKKPSPLSHSGAAAAQVGEEDDADTNASYGGSDEDIGGRTTPIPGGRGKEKDPSKKSGLSGKLRKALSFNALPDAAQQPELSGGGRAGTLPHRRGPVGLPSGVHSSNDTNGSSGSARSTSPPRTPDNGASPLPNSSSAASISSRRSNRPPISGSGDGGGKRSIFNRKFNSSTDNISISSTVSSASVMLRKVGNLGKMARRHSLMGLTNMFNKDKDGREGLQDDSFGTPAFGSSSSVAIGEDAGTSSKKEKKNKSKKGAPAAASISHATVELESGNDVNGAMTSAASYARQHQAAAAKAEAEARAQREKAEAEAKLNASKKGKTTDDVMESRQKAIEKEKERLKSKRGWRKKLGGGSVSSIASESSPTGLETTYAQAAANAVAPVALTGGNDASSGYGGYSSPELAGQYPHHQQQQQQVYEDPINNSFDDEELEPPHMPGAGGGAEDSGDEYETDSLRHWGEGIEKSRASAQSVSSVKSILKNQANPNGPGSGPPSRGKNAPPSAADRPFSGRVRANSYDAQPSSAIQSSGPHHAPLMNQMSNTVAGVDRMDGVPRSASASENDDGSHGASKATEDEESRTVASVSSHSGTPIGNSDPPMGHHSNASMPTLSLMLGNSTSTSAPRAVGGEKRRIAFAEQQIYHSTWPAHVYDRRGELATCNRLTPLLAQRIKEVSSEKRELPKADCMRSSIRRPSRMSEIN